MEGRNRTKSIEGDLDIENDILDKFTPSQNPDIIPEYEQKLRDMDNGSQSVNWRVIVLLNNLLNKNSLCCWWYDEFLKEREEFMYVPKDLPDSTYKSGPRKNQRKVKTKKMLEDDYNRLFSSEEIRIFKKPKNQMEYVNLCVKKIVEEKMEKDGVVIIPDIESIRSFLEEHKREINETIKQIKPGNRGIISWTDFRFVADQGWNESKKFAHPLYTVLSLSDPVLSLRGLIPWFRKEITGKKNQYRNIPDSRGYYQPFSGGDSYIAINDNIREILAGNSLQLCKVLLEYIDVKVLNMPCSISPVTEVIKYATMKYPKNPLPGYNHDPIVAIEKRLNLLADTSHKIFEMLVHVGLEDQLLRRITFDVFGGTWVRVQATDEGLEMDPKYMDMNDPQLQHLAHVPRARTLMMLCHPEMRKIWDTVPKLFENRKLLNFGVGLNDPKSPLYYLDKDSSDTVGIELSRRKSKYPATESMRRNYFSRGNMEDLIKSQQRLKMARGLNNLTSYIGPQSKIDMENILKIIDEHKEGNLLEDSKYSESRMGPEDYVESPPPQFQIGDRIMWGDGLTGVVIGTPRGNLKILGDNMKKYFLSNKTRNMKLIEREPFIESVDGGGSKKKRTKRKMKKKRTVRKSKAKLGSGVYLEFRSGPSRKFWRIVKNGTKLTTHYGRLGSLGQMTTKDYGSKVDQEYDKLIQSKKKKGYVEKIDFGDPNPKKPTAIEREYMKICNKAERSKVLNPNQNNSDCEGMLDQGESELKWMTQWHKDALTKGEYDWDKYTEHYKSKKRTKKKKTKNQVGGFLKSRVHDALDCDNIDDGEKSTEKCVKNLLRKILVGPDGKKLIESFIDEDPPVTLQTYIQELLKKILVGPDGQELIKSFIDEDSPVTLQKYFEKVVKNILWSIAGSLLVGKDSINLPKSWDHNLDEQGLDNDTINIVIERTGIPEGEELDPNICLRKLWRAVLIELLQIPGRKSIKILIDNLFGKEGGIEYPREPVDQPEDRSIYYDHKYG